MGLPVQTPFDFTELTRKFHQEVKLPQLTNMIDQYYPYQQELQKNLSELTKWMIFRPPFDLIQDFERYEKCLESRHHYDGSVDSKPYTKEELRTEVLFGLYVFELSVLIPENVMIPVGNPDSFTTLGQLFNQILTGLSRKLTPEDINLFRNSEEEADNRMAETLTSGESTIADSIWDDLYMQGPVECNEKTRKCIIELTG